MNQNKTQTCFFTTRRTKQVPTEPLEMDSALIQWENRVKYLGVVLDKRLTFKDHINNVCKKVHKATRILYSLLNRRSRLNVSNKLLLYKAAIRPLITYACPVLMEMAGTHHKCIQVLQNKILRMILNITWYTATIDIHQEADIATLKEHMLDLSARFDSRTADIAPFVQ